MTPFRPLLSALLLIAAVSVACSIVPGTEVTRTAQDGQRAALQPLGTPEVSNAPMSAVLMGENKPSATLEPVATVDRVGTQMFYVNAVKTANAESNILRQQLIDANNEGKRIELTTSANQADTAKYNAANRATSAKETQSAIDLQAAYALQKQADAQAIEAQADLTRAQTEREQGAQRNGAGILMAAVVVCLTLLMYRAMNRPYVEQVASDEPEEDEPEPVSEPDEPEDNDGLPRGIDAQTMRKFMTYAVTGAPLGAESMAKAWGTSPAQRKKRQAILLHLAIEGHVNRFAKPLVLNTAGVIIWEIWLKAHPPTSEELAENSAAALHDDVLHGGKPAGEGLTDHFGVIDEHTKSQFLPSGDIRNAPLSAKKDDEK